MTFTFHYVSTYTRKRSLDANAYYIYIPLCFYLYQIEILKACRNTDIYIPLCFYLY